MGKRNPKSTDASSFWDWSLDEMVDWERGVISEQTPMIIEELNTLSEERDLVLFENLRSRGFKQATIGVEVGDEKNLQIYQHFGFVHYVK